MPWFATHPAHCLEYNAVTREPFEDIACILRHYGTSQRSSSSMGSRASGRVATWLSRSYMDWEYRLMSVLPDPEWNWIVWAVVMSAVILWLGQIVMLRRPPFQIRRWITSWNALWILFTALGFLRMCPVVIHNWTHFTVQDNVCASAASLWTSGTTGLWAKLWIYAKAMEVVVESFLVVLLKQPPCGLLQWFNTYAYVLAHGWHLYTAPVPGGAAVLMVYYAILGFMNAYCFYLNWFHLPQPTKPTALLDIIHLLQTLSGVVLSVTTLHFWKQAVWSRHIHCHANERHIRIMAFSWSGGHVILWCVSLAYQALLARYRAYIADNYELLRAQRKKLRRSSHSSHNSNSNSKSGELRLKKKSHKTHTTKQHKHKHRHHGQDQTGTIITTVTPGTPNDDHKNETINTNTNTATNTETPLPKSTPEDEPQDPPELVEEQDLSNDTTTRESPSTTAATTTPKKKRTKAQFVAEKVVAAQDAAEADADADALAAAAAADVSEDAKKDKDDDPINTASLLRNGIHNNKPETTATSTATSITNQETTTTKKEDNEDKDENVDTDTDDADTMTTTSKNLEPNDKNDPDADGVASKSAGDSTKMKEKKKDDNNNNEHLKTE